MANANMQLSKETINALKNIDYVSGSDGQIFFDNVLLDECFDIQYSYREMKEPVYGYRSTTFDAVLPGTVIVTGQFAINYIHDAYLFTILNAGKIESMSNASSGGVDISAIKKTLPGTLSKGFDKKNLLQQYNELRKAYNAKEGSISSLKSKINMYNAQLIDIQNKKQAAQEAKENQLNSITEQESSWIDSMWSSADGKNERLTAADNNLTNYDECMAYWKDNADCISNGDYDLLSFFFSESIQSQYATYLTEWENLIFADGYNQDSVQGDRVFDLEVAITQLNDQYKTEIDRFIEPSLFNRDTETLAKFRTASQQAVLQYQVTEAQLENTKKKIEAAKTKAADEQKTLDNLKIQLDKLKTQLSSPSAGQYTSIANVEGDSSFKKLDTLAYMQTGAAAKAGAIRSTMNKSFNIDFIYNNVHHKRLKNVYILGYTHELSVGGNPIREIYSFIAKDVINTKN